MTHEAAENAERYAPIHGVELDESIHSFHMWVGCALKYAWRFPRKGGINDLRKMLDCMGRSYKTVGDIPLVRKSMGQLALFKLFEKLVGSLSEVVPPCNNAKHLVTNCQTPAGFSAGLHAAVLINILTFACAHMSATTRHPGDSIDMDDLRAMKRTIREIDSIIEELEKRDAEPVFLDIRGQSRRVQTLDDVWLADHAHLL